MSRSEICTCGHYRHLHAELPDALFSACIWPACPCKRYDRRNLSDAEQEQLRREEIDRLRKETTTAPQAKEGVFDRIAGALEQIARALEVLTRPVLAEHPCVQGGKHIYVHDEDGRARCQKCKQPITAEQL